MPFKILVALLIATAASLLGTAPAMAAASATLRLGRFTPSEQSDYVDLPISLSSPDQAVSQVTVALTLSSGLRLADSSYQGSVFPNIVSGPVQSGNQVDFTVSRPDVGYAGSLGRVADLAFTVSGTGTATASLNPGASRAITDSGGENILGTNAGPTVTYAASNAGLAAYAGKTLTNIPTTDPRTGLTEAGTLPGSSMAASDNSSQIDWDNPLVRLRFGSLGLGVILLLCSAAGFMLSRLQRTDGQANPERP